MLKVTLSSSLLLLRSTTSSDTVLTRRNADSSCDLRGMRRADGGGEGCRSEGVLARGVYASCIGPELEGRAASCSCVPPLLKQLRTQPSCCLGCPLLRPPAGAPAPRLRRLASSQHTCAGRRALIGARLTSTSSSDMMTDAAMDSHAPVSVASVRSLGIFL